MIRPIKQFILISSFSILLVLIISTLSSGRAIVASIAADRVTYTNSDMGVTFQHPSYWYSQPLTQSIDNHTVLFNPNKAAITTQVEIEPDEDFKQSLVVTRKTTRGSVPQSKEIKNLSPIEYINREAAGIGSEIEITEKIIGKYQTYIVKRNSAGTTHKMTIYYVFRGTEVFRISLFDSDLNDPRLSIAEEFISTLNFDR